MPADSPDPGLVAKTWRVEVAYRTKRGGVCCGMSLKAEDENDALEIGMRMILKGYPARKFAYARVTEENA